MRTFSDAERTVVSTKNSVCGKKTCGEWCGEIIGRARRSNALVAHLLSEQEIDRTELDQLQKLIRTRKQQRKDGSYPGFSEGLPANTYNIMEPGLDALVARFGEPGS